MQRNAGDEEGTRPRIARFANGRGTRASWEIAKGPEIVRIGTEIARFTDAIAVAQSLDFVIASATEESDRLANEDLIQSNPGSFFTNPVYSCTAISCF